MKTYQEYFEEAKKITGENVAWSTVQSVVDSLINIDKTKQLEQIKVEIFELKEELKNFGIEP